LIEIIDYQGIGVRIELPYWVSTMELLETYQLLQRQVFLKNQIMTHHPFSSLNPTKGSSRDNSGTQRTQIEKEKRKEVKMTVLVKAKSKRIWDVTSTVIQGVIGEIEKEGDSLLFKSRLCEEFTIEDLETIIKGMKWAKLLKEN